MNVVEINEQPEIGFQEKNQRNVAERVPCGRNFIFAGTDLVVRRTSYTGDKATLVIICFINTF